MLRRFLPGICGLLMVMAAWLGNSANASAADDPPLPRFYYYPYYYFPHSYWPTYSQQWPEPHGAPYMRPPAYMAFPPFREPNWRYEMWAPHKYHRGHHFWLDSF